MQIGVVLNVLLLVQVHAWQLLIFWEFFWNGSADLENENFKQTSKQIEEAPSVFLA
jgi:hypothetical protein